MHRSSIEMSPSIATVTNEWVSDGEVYRRLVTLSKFAPARWTKTHLLLISYMDLGIKLSYIKLPFYSMGAFYV